MGLTRKIVEKHESILSVWIPSDEPVLVIGERDALLTDKRAVLEAYLAKVAENVMGKDHLLSDPRIDSARRDNRKLVTENRKLKKDLNEVRDRIEAVENRLSGLAGEEKVIVLRAITREEAKDEIKGLFDAGRVLYYSDIADELRIDLELAVEICQELENEGEIEVNDDSEE